MKRLFPLVNILLITAISFLGVDSMYTLFAARLDTVDQPKPIISKKNRINPTKMKSPPLSQYRTIVERDIFQSRTADSGTKVEEMVLADIKPTERNLKLWGTVVGDSSASAYAIIEEPDDRSRRSKQFLHRPGDVVQGATIKRILREKVILSAEGKNEILQLAERKSDGRYRRSRHTSSQRSKQPIRQKRVLRSSRIQKAIGNIDSVQSQANIRPHSEGFRITRIRPSSIFRRMGLRNGDIITAVGGRPITSPNDTLDTWRNLTAGGETSVKIKRRGRMRIIDYQIR
jgi:general secretion pathway protein C